MSENAIIYAPGKNVTLPPAVTIWSNLTSEEREALGEERRQPASFFLGEYETQKAKLN